MELTLQDLLTTGGATALVLILTAVLKRTWPNFNSDRFGAITAIVLGIAIVALANAGTIVEVRLGWGEAVLTGLLAGAAASGLYDAGRGLTSS